jgi:hypothetical protein
MSLTAVEGRVLGVLIEKEAIRPDLHPLTALRVWMGLQPERFPQTWGDRLRERCRNFRVMPGVFSESNGQHCMKAIGGLGLTLLCAFGQH